MEILDKPLNSVAAIDDRSRLTRLINSLANPIDNSSVTFFRIGFGVMFAWWAWDYLDSGRVSALYVEPKFHFKYPLFDWVNPWPAAGMYCTFIAVIVLGLLVAAGIWYRVSALILAVTFTYIFLLEKTNYQNHYYLLILIAWWLPILPLARNVSCDAYWNPSIAGLTTSAWVLWILRFHIGLPYFFGGVAKLHGDWLAGEPMRQILASQSQLPLVGPWLSNEGAVWLFVWGGLIFDLGIVPLLLMRKTRTQAYVLCVAFHLTNAVIFSIHVFPWFMIFATTLFFEPDWPRKVLGGTPLTLPQNGHVRWSNLSLQTKIGSLSTLLYCVFHCLWPLRHLGFEGDPSWTERCHMFSWRMMLRGKTAGVRYFILDPKSKEVYNPNLRGVINVEQANRFTRDPEMIVQLAHFLAYQHERRTGNFPQIKALVLTSLNGRKPQLFIDPDTDLSKEPRFAMNRTWLQPLREPLRDTPWRVPLAEWEKNLEVPPLPIVNSRGPNESN
jgi:vitamin K-dependent gamma-carboxylase